MKREAVSIALLAFALTVFTSTATSVTLEVDGDYSTIQAAVNNASAGDTVEITPGTYSEDVDVNVSGLTLTSTGATEDTVVEGRISVRAPDVTIEGLTITNPDGGPESFVGVKVANGIAADAGSNTDGLTVKDNYIHDIGTELSASTLSDGAGVLLFGTNDALIEENVIEGVRGGTHPVFDNRAAKGVHLGDSGSTTSDVTIRGNEISDVKNYANTDDAIGVLVYTGGADDIEIMENDFSEIEGNAGNGVSVGGPATDVTVYGNTFEEMTSYRQPGNRSVATVFWGGEVSTFEVNRNNFYTDIGVANYLTEGEVDATENYWGHASGPSARTNPAGKQVGKGAGVIGDVDWNNYLVKPFGLTPVQTPAPAERGP